MLFLFLILLSGGIATGPTEIDNTAKLSHASVNKTAGIPSFAAGQRGKQRKQVEYLPPAEGLHPKSVIFPGSKGGAWPTHYLYHEPDGCVLPQKPDSRTMDGPLTPAETNATGLKGIFLLLHACAYNSDDWFALPEEVPMVRDLLSRGFLLVAPDAIVQPGGCWAMELNMGSLLYSFDLFLSAFGLQGFPLYGVGSSSGGTMLSGLVAHIDFAGTMFIVSPGTAELNSVGTFSQKDHPPTAFVLMPPDTFGVKSYIMGAVQALQNNGVPVVTFEVEPKPVAALVDRADDMRIDKPVVQQMVSDISNVYFCRMKRPSMQFYLIPGYSDSIYTTLIGRYALTPVQTKSLWEELKVVEAVHSPTSEHFSESVDFLLTSQASTKALRLVHSSKAAEVDMVLSARTRNDTVPGSASTKIFLKKATIAAGLRP